MRLVDDDLWTRAQARLDQTRRAYLRGTGGKLWGRPETGLESKYLLTGLAVCGVCGASLHVRHRRSGGRASDYRCGWHFSRGAAACPNARAMPMDAANAAVLTTLREDVLTPETVAAIVATALARHRDAPGHGRRRTGPR